MFAVRCGNVRRLHEDRITVGGKRKAPAYSFRIAGVRKFFVEAKHPSIPLEEHKAPAFQLRRYAWSANLPLRSLITCSHTSRSESPVTSGSNPNCTYNGIAANG
jgi:hypothetical protein